jgi:xylose isomerase
LEDAGWEGMRHFDAHPYRTEDAEGVWDFARGCMRTYLVLREKVRQFQGDAEIAAAMAVADVRAINEPTSPDGLGSDAIEAIRTSTGSVSEAELGARGYGHERLDQLVTELLLGVRPGS